MSYLTEILDRRLLPISTANRNLKTALYRLRKLRGIRATMRRGASFGVACSLNQTNRRNALIWIRAYNKFGMAGLVGKHGGK